MKSTRETIFECFMHFRNVTTDTRNLSQDSIFFALKGQNFNGNDFQEDALLKGCALVVVDEKRVDDERIVEVTDVLQALQNLALDYRMTWDFPVIALTGSNGKTTTKELMRDVLATTHKVHATKGNLNNHIGIPLTILSAPDDTEIAVIEMGANHQREIASYCNYALPTHGYITNIGKAHLEGFGGPVGVKKGKKELYDYLHLSGGKIFVNHELPFMKEITNGMEVIPFRSMSHFQAEDKGYGMNISISEDGEIFNFDCHLTGLYNLYNVCVAWEIGRYFKVLPSKISQAISAYQPENMRSQWKETSKNKLILDAYNANPTSLENAIIHLSQQRNADILAIVGEMREMGDSSEAEHKHIVNVLEEHRVPSILVGKEFAFASAQHAWFENVNELVQYLNMNPIEGKLILIKGSRGIQLEKVLPSL
jgi:UDP-N-acetylmuramoyl-tripeptide--D-alanyl-D-alanine ligase